MVTLAVEDRYGTKMVRDPSLPRKPEFRRNKRWPLAFSSDLSFSHLLLAYALPMTDSASANIVTVRAVVEVCPTLDRTYPTYRRYSARRGSLGCRRVECAAISMAVCGSTGVPVGDWLSPSGQWLLQGVK